MLLCHHIIGGGAEAFAAALADPAAAVRAVWPPGVGRWCVVSEVEAQLAEEDRQSNGATQKRSSASPRPARAAAAAAAAALSRERPERELCVQSAAFVYALLWWPTVAWHGAKWRLCAQLCSPWEIGKPRKDAGVLELVALIARYARDDPGEHIPRAVQDAELKWVIGKS